MKLRTGNRRRRRAHSIAEAKRIRIQRLDKLWRLTRRQLIKAVVKHLEDQILYGSGLSAGGGLIDPAKWPPADLRGEIVKPLRPRMRFAEELPIQIQTPIRIVVHP